MFPNSNISFYRHNSSGTGKFEGCLIKQPGFQLHANVVPKKGLPGSLLLIHEFGQFDEPFLISPDQQPLNTAAVPGDLPQTPRFQFAANNRPNYGSPRIQLFLHSYSCSMKVKISITARSGRSGSRGWPDSPGDQNWRGRRTAPRLPRTARNRPEMT